MLKVKSSVDKVTVSFLLKYSSFFLSFVDLVVLADFSHFLYCISHESYSLLLMENSPLHDLLLVSLWTNAQQVLQTGTISVICMSNFT